MPVITDPLEFALAVEIDLPTPLRLWTGSETDTGALSFDGESYAYGDILDVSPATVSPTETSTTMTISIAAVSNERRTTLFGSDPGPKDVSIHALWRQRAGGVWTAWTEAFSYGGVLSTPSADLEALSIEVSQALDDVDRGTVQYMSDTEQRKRFPGDKGLYMLARKGGSVISLAWPA